MSSRTYRSPWIPDDLLIFRKTIREFIHNEFSPNQSLWREQPRSDAEAWAAAGAAGRLSTDIPEQYGGGRGAFADEAIVFEELSRAGVHFASHLQSGVAHYIFAYGI